MILDYFVNAKLQSQIQAYTVSAAGPAGVRSRRAKSTYIQSHSVMSLTIFGREKDFLDKKLLL